MAAAGLLKTLDDGGDGRLQKEELTVDAHLPHGIQGAEQLIEIFPASDVTDHGHLVIAAAAAQAQLREAGHEQCGHIVNGVKPFVLQKLSCRALASTGESGDDDHLHRFFHSFRMFSLFPKWNQGIRLISSSKVIPFFSRTISRI